MNNKQRSTLSSYLFLVAMDEVTKEIQGETMVHKSVVKPTLLYNSVLGG